MELMNLIAIVTLGIFAETSYLVAQSVKPAKVKNSILLDTSVLIDGRIVSIVRSGLVSAKLIVPRSVVRELQFMADKADHDKRERARYGLDVIDQLQNLEGVTLEVVDDGITSQKGVDEQLMNLAMKWQAKLCTIDYNLNKSARVQGIQVINVNELAQALRVNYLPGESLQVSLIQPGQESHQAVGYLDDGTMVVVDNAKTFIGKSITVEATRVLQTAAGKMMFAKHHETVKRIQSTRSAQQKPARRQGASSKQRNNNSRNSASPKMKSSAAKAEDSLVKLANRR